MVINLRLGMLESVYRRKPVWVSLSGCHVCTWNQKLPNLLANLLPFGIPSAERLRLPTTMIRFSPAAISFSATAVRLPMSSGKCCPSLSSVTA